MSFYDKRSSKWVDTSFTGAERSVSVVSSDIRGLVRSARRTDARVERLKFPCHGGEAEVRAIYHEDVRTSNSRPGV